MLWHGWGSNLRIFDSLRSALSAHWTVHAVDLPGYGYSVPAAPGVLAATDECFELLLASLPAEPCHLLGWSLGGQWALRAASTGRARIRSLTLAHTTPRFVADDGWLHGVSAAVLRQFGAQLTASPVQCLRDFLELQLRGERGAAPPVPRLLQELQQHGLAGEPVLRRDLRHLADWDLRPLLPELETPALVISGQYDRVTPPAAGRALAAALRRARLLEVGRAGHLSFLSHPQVILQELRAFLHSIDEAAT